MTPGAFFLGTHKPQWLGRLRVPLFVSRRRLAERVRLPRALGQWALDSGGFTEITLHGRWTVPPRQYVEEVRRFRDEVGGLQWAAIQDWMCEPSMLARTGLSVEEHQRRTVESLAELLALAPELPWAPVIQGWSRGDYWRHVGMYAAAGFDLSAPRWPVVGIGSVCRRQHTAEAEQTIREISSAGVRLHGFGFKVLGLDRVGDVLASSDSMAWSLDARRAPPLPGCEHKSCSNCPAWALRWRERVEARLGVARSQMRMQLDIRRAVS